MTPERRCIKAVITGRVQGVGYRYWARDEALAMGLTGWVRNCPDGLVEALICGPDAAVEGMIAACRRGPAFAAVRDVAVEEQPDMHFETFEIRR